jgi:hypothetical protein
MATTPIENTAQMLPALTGKILYILYYRQGANPHPQFLFFYHNSSDMKIIAERAKKHCDFMNFRFVYVRPAVVDLDKMENLHAEG